MPLDIPRPPQSGESCSGHLLTHQATGLFGARKQQLLRRFNEFIPEKHQPRYHRYRGLYFIKQATGEWPSNGLPALAGRTSKVHSTVLLKHLSDTVVSETLGGSQRISETHITIITTFACQPELLQNLQDILLQTSNKIEAMTLTCTNHWKIWHEQTWFDKTKIKYTKQTSHRLLRSNSSPPTPLASPG